MSTNELFLRSIRLNQEVTASLYRINNLQGEERIKEIEATEKKMQELEELEDKLEVALLTGGAL